MKHHQLVGLLLSLLMLSQSYGGMIQRNLNKVNYDMASALIRERQCLRNKVDLITGAKVVLVNLDNLCVLQ